MPHMEGIFINGEKAKFHPEDILDTDASQYTEEIGESVTAFLTEHLTNPTNPPIDTSLSIAGAAADAKKTGDEISELKEDLSEQTKNLFDYHKLQATGITINNGVATGTASAFNTAFNQSIPLDVAFEENTQYTWSFKAINLGETVTGNGLSVRFKYTDDTVSANAIPNSKTTETQFSFTSEAGKTVASLVITFSSAGSNTWKLSNIQLEKGTTATAYIPYVTAVDIIARDNIDEIEAALTTIESLFPNILQSAITAQLSPNNHSLYGIDDLSDFPINRMYGMVNITENDISGFPEYGTYATFIKFNPLPTNGFSVSLYVIATTTDVKKVYIRFGYADNTGTNWKLLGSSQQKSFSIIGDSYSTFTNWLVSGNATYYPTNSATVLNVSDTWWYKLSKQLGWSLLINDSYSGSTICTDVRTTSDESEAFVNRIKTSIGENRVTEPKPDVIFMFGGTNDSSLGRTVGSVQYSGWTDTDLKQVIPAFCYMCDYLQTWNPNATIVNIVNTGLNADIVSGMETACEHYGIINVALDDIDKASGHPTATGMTSICNQVISAISQII